MTINMSPHEREHLNALCEQIAKETDQWRFLKLLHELNQLLERNKTQSQDGNIASKLNPA
jgi:hypothetical protein